MTHKAKDNANKEAVTKLLNKILAPELVFVLRYKRHDFIAKGIHTESVKSEFFAHAKEEIAHGEPVAKRITELGYAG